MRWDEHDHTAEYVALPDLFTEVPDPTRVLPGDRATFVLDPPPDVPAQARTPVVQRDPNLIAHIEFATQLARQRRWLVALTVAVALLVPAAAVVYGAAIAIARAALQGGL